MSLDRDITDKLKELFRLRKYIRKAKKQDAHGTVENFKRIRRKKIKEIRRDIINQGIKGNENNS